MIVLYILLAIVALLLFLLFLDVHLIFSYNEKATVTLKILFFRFDGIELFKKFSDQKESTSDEKQNKKELQKENQKSARKGDFLGFCEFLVRIGRIIGLAVKEHFSKMKINLKELRVSIGTEDAAKTALATGGAIAAANGLCALLQRFSNFRCDNRKLSISPDFTSDQSSFRIHLILTSKIVHLIGIIFRSYLRFFERKEVKNARNSVKTSH